MNQVINKLFCEIADLKNAIIKKLSVLFYGNTLTSDTSSINFEGNAVEVTSTNSKVKVVINQSQSDWNETNITSPSFIKNKPIGGGGSTLTIPTPIVTFKDYELDDMYQVMRVSYINNGSSEWLNYNPQIFLFRNKLDNKRHFSTGGYQNLKSGYVHPSTYDAATKWQGWKFFGGAHTTSSGYPSVDGLPIEGRETEWIISNPTTDFKSYMYYEILIPRMLFTSYTSDIAGEMYDSLPTDFLTNIPNIEEIRYGTGTRKKRTLQKRLNEIVYINTNTKGLSALSKYKIAFCIDNPTATLTNGECPVIFGPLSEEFYQKAYCPIALYNLERGRLIPKFSNSPK